MTKIIKSVLAISTSVLLIVPAINAAEKTLELDNIENIVASAGISLVMRQADLQSVMVETEQDWDLDHLVFSYEDKTLSVSQEYNFWDFASRGKLINAFFPDGKRIQIIIGLPTINSIKLSSGAELDLEGFSGDQLSIQTSSGASAQMANIAYENIEFSASSGASISAGGTCTALNADASSGADILATDLICNTANASASSGADIDIFANQSVSASASSGGDVDVYGSPNSVTENESSGGSVQTK